MEFDRYFELTLKGIANLATVTRWIDKELGIEYEVELDTDNRYTASEGTVTLFSINTEEDNKLNAWLDEQEYQKQD